MSDPFEDGLAEGALKREVEISENIRKVRDISVLRKKLVEKLGRRFQISDNDTFLRITRKLGVGGVKIISIGDGRYRCSSVLEGERDGTLDDTLRYVGRWVARQAP